MLRSSRFANRTGAIENEWRRVDCTYGADVADAADVADVADAADAADVADAAGGCGGTGAGRRMRGDGCGETGAAMGCPGSISPAAIQSQPPITSRKLLVKNTGIIVI